MLLNLKQLTLISCLLIASVSVNANNGGTPINQLNVTLLTSGKVQIETLAIQPTATYQIEKSYDNINFSTVAIVLPNEAIASDKSIFFKDNVSQNKKKVYYRLKVINNNSSNIAATNTVSL